MGLRFGFCPTEGGHFFREALAEVARAEELGFDSVWMAEHHGVPDHYWPSPLMALAGFAILTSRLVLGSNVVVVPFYHPVRLAEEIALLDVISQGRVVAGMAIGYKMDEFLLYGASLERRGARFEEALVLMKALWSQERVTFHGEHYRVEDARIEPRPVAQPHPPMWISGWGPLTLRRAAILADAWIPGPTADLTRLLNAKRTILGHRAAVGLPERAEWPLTREVIIADTDREARDLAERYLLIAYQKEYGGTWRHPFIDAATASDLDRLMANRFLIGSPERVIQALEPFVREFGATHLICRLYFPGMPHRHIMRELQLVAREVMPAFR